MKIVGTITHFREASIAEEMGADALEFRMDLTDGDPTEQIRTCRSVSSLPMIATLRSGREGGYYFGESEGWWEKIMPILPSIDYLDIELNFALYSEEVRRKGITIIASSHLPFMPDLPTLFTLERDLRNYGDIVKLFVTPRDEDDLLTLLSFTRAIKRPLCTGVIGTQFRYGRVLLPLFGSALAYCHSGRPVADGQYSVAEFLEIWNLLSESPKDFYVSHKNTRDWIPQGD